MFTFAVWKSHEINGRMIFFIFTDATEKMDAILSSDTAWERLIGPDIDDMKVTECAEAFLTLLMTITDRYSHLPQPGHRLVVIWNLTLSNGFWLTVNCIHRLQFLELQLELVDDWRVRLLQLLHEAYEDPLASIMPRILNTLHYVSSVLIEWGSTVVSSRECDKSLLRCWEQFRAPVFLAALPTATLLQKTVWCGWIRSG